MGHMIFNGKSTETLGVVIQTPPVYEFPSRRMDVIQIHGKNGDLLLDRESFDNVNREYNLACVFEDGTSFVSNVRALVDWLTSVKGYARLEDTYEPDYFRLAVYRSGGQLVNFYDIATVMAVTFECKPQRFLKIGENSVPILEEDSWILELENPTSCIALPEISIEGTDLILTIEHKVSGVFESTTVIQISGSTGVGCKIDSELQDCYNDTAYLNNNTTVSNGFPKLYPGTNRITITKDDAESIITSASVKPRWWVL